MKYNQGDGTIVDDDPIPSLSIDDVAINEGDAGQTNATFTVSLSAVSGKDVTADFATADGNATTGQDYTTTNGQVSIPAGGTSDTIDVPVSGDEVVELDETYTVTLTNPTNATIGDGQGDGTITNDDSATLSIDDVTSAEGNSPDTQTYTFTVTLDANVDTNVDVDIATADDSAEDENGDNDYTSNSDTLNFVGNANEQMTFDVEVNGDDKLEPDETFTVNLSGINASGRDVNAGSPGMGTITNDDSADLSINDVALVEGDSGTTTLTFTVTLSAAVGGGVDVDFTTTDGSAEDENGDNDYTANSGTLNFVGNAGEQKTIDVEVNGDGKEEPDEKFTIDLSNATNGVGITDAEGEGTITNDDDTTFPDAITTLQIIGNVAPGIITLRWQNTGDDGTSGQASVLDIRHSVTAIVDDASFNTADQVVGEPVPDAPGTFQTFAVTVPFGQLRHFAMKIGDEVPNFSDLSNVVSDIPLAIELGSFTGTMTPDGVRIRWQTISETNNLGFNIYRSNTRDAEYVKLNIVYITGAGTDAAPNNYTFTDESAEPDKTYYYYIEDVDFAGITSKSNIISVTTIGLKGTEDPQSRISAIPAQFALHQNYPNPFNPETWLPYDLAEDATVILRIFDVSGRLVRELDMGNQNAGRYQIKGQAAYWDGKDQAGNVVSNGLYFYLLTAGDFQATRRMVILK